MIKKMEKKKQLVIKKIFFGDLSWSVVFYFLHFTKKIYIFHNHVSQSAELSGGFRGGGGALGASAPPAESMVKNLNLTFLFTMYGRYLFACSVSPVKSQHPRDKNGC